MEDYEEFMPDEFLSDEFLPDEEEELAAEEGTNRQFTILVAALASALEAEAEEAPDTLLRRAERGKDTGSAIVQRLVARALVRATPARPQRVLRWLMADRRRMRLGDDFHAVGIGMIIHEPSWHILNLFVFRSVQNPSAKSLH